MEKNSQTSYAENIAYLRDVLGVRYLNFPDKVAPEISVTPLAETAATMSTSRNSAPSPLKNLRKVAETCTLCKLSKTRQNVVFGDGDHGAEIMFVGEGPGEQDDVLGMPFQGPGGELLGKMIIAMNLERSKVYLTNLVKCRPPLDRDPASSEITQCVSNYLNHQIEMVNPKVIVALGEIAAQNLFQSAEKLRVLRTKSHEANGRKIFATFHPLELLKNPQQKKQVWEDLQNVMGALGLKKTR